MAWLHVLCTKCGLRFKPRNALFVIERVSQIYGNKTTDYVGWILTNSFLRSKTFLIRCYQIMQCIPGKILSMLLWFLYNQMCFHTVSSLGKMKINNSSITINPEFVLSPARASNSINEHYQYAVIFYPCLRIFADSMDI